jgi:hypothetical protein
MFFGFGKFGIDSEVYMQDQNGVKTQLGTEHFEFTVIPMQKIKQGVGLFLAIFVLVFAYLTWHERVYGGGGWKSYTVKAGDTVMGLAALYGTKWKILAKVNKLEEPYALTAGQSILLPPKAVQAAPTASVEIPQETPEAPVKEKKEKPAPHSAPKGGKTKK